MDVLHKLSTYLYKKFAYSKMKSDHRGLTMVELICAIAIMSLVGAGVSGFMIVGANTYRSGTTEVELQTEAQMVVNQIGDLVIDTTAIIKGYDASGAEVKEDAIKLTIDSTDKHYEIWYAKAAEDAAGKVFYSEYQVLADGTLIALPDEASKNQLMAENVTEFKSDIRDFQASGILRLYMKLEKDNRVYVAYYTITARNGRYTVDGGGVEISANVVAPSEIVVEPNQDYLLSATVVGVSNNAVKWNLSGNFAGDTYVIQEADGWHLHVGSNEISNSMMLTVSTAAMNGTEPLDKTYVQVRLRRVNELKLNGILISGEGMKAGATYRITPEFVGTTLPRLLGSESDMDYVDPYKFNWLNVELTGASGSASDYYTWTPHDDYAELILKKDLENVGLTVYARALHPDGMNGSTLTNKTGYSYAEVIGEWKLDSGFKISVSNGGFARGGYSDVLLQNVLDEWINWDLEYDHWDNEKGESVYRKGSQNHNYIDLKFYVFKYWTPDSNFNVWIEGGHNNMAATGDEAQRFFDTNVGFKTTVVPGDSLDLAEYLNYDFYSYSTPYYIGRFDTSISQIKMELTLYEGNSASGPSHTASVILNVPEVAFQFRNSSEGTWSSQDGALVVYVTPEDRMEDDIYTSYFQLLDGWSSDNKDYVAYNRFVGVVEDKDGFENDIRHDLTFVNSAGVECPRPLPTEKDKGIEGDMYYDGWNVLQNNGNLNRQVISSGSNGLCTVSVKIPEEERKTLAAGAGTVIKEIYEYNYLFGTETLKQWYYDRSAPIWDMYNTVDGCDGYLEYHFVPANIASTVVGPSVRYCPRPGDAGLDANNIYYISDRERFKVLSGSSAIYQTKDGGTWNDAVTLSWGEVGVAATEYYIDSTKRYVFSEGAPVSYQEKSGNTWNTIRTLTWEDAWEKVAAKDGLKKGIKVETETIDLWSNMVQATIYYISDTERYALVPAWNNEVYHQVYKETDWFTGWETQGNKLTWDDVKDKLLDEDGIDDDIVVKTGTTMVNKWVAN